MIFNHAILAAITLADVAIYDHGYLQRHSQSATIEAHVDGLVLRELPFCLNELFERYNAFTMPQSYYFTFRQREFDVEVLLREKERGQSVEGESLELTGRVFGCAYTREERSGMLELDRVWLAQE